MKKKCTKICFHFSVVEEIFPFIADFLLMIAFVVREHVTFSIFVIPGLFYAFRDVLFYFFCLQRKKNLF